jgi:hypothetical protein
MRWWGRLGLIYVRKGEKSKDLEGLDKGITPETEDKGITPERQRMDARGWIAEGYRSKRARKRKGGSRKERQKGSER